MGDFSDLIDWRESYQAWQTSGIENITFVILMQDKNLRFGERSHEMQPSSFR